MVRPDPPFHDPAPRGAPSHPPADAGALLRQLALATVALDAALDTFGTDPEPLRDAAEALDAFDLLERTVTGFVVPREVRRLVREARHHLRTEQLELARADAARAGSALERHLLPGRGGPH